MANNQKQNRTLTDEDVEAIAEALKAKVVEEFYRDLGKGFWAIAWRAIVSFLVILAGYGATKGIMAK